MNENELKFIDIDGKNCFLVDSLVGNNTTYHFFSENKKDGEIYVLKDMLQDGEEYFVSLDNEEELDYAFQLFNEKYNDIDNA